MIPRPYYTDIYHEPSSEKAMLFSAGPRQSGKKNLAKMIANACINQLYSIWDIPEDPLRESYMWDGPRIKEPVARFENMVAVELYRAVTLWRDLGWAPTACIS